MIIAIACAISIVLTAYGKLTIRLAIAYSIRKNASKKKR
ncbi:hypothetical protein LACDD01_02164 [Lactococcus sp. DD01]|nr:hypothetical protein LACDD01_02164 [Lactococcus sp. DD01]